MLTLVRFQVYAEATSVPFCSIPALGGSVERTSGRPIRVVQWTTGNVARQSVAAIVERPGLELVGVYAHSKEKAGRDVGELARLGRTLGCGALACGRDVTTSMPHSCRYHDMTSTFMSLPEAGAG